ncbi:aldo/keto reductase [Candidatus Marimicrobium litorale]|uniref:Aldo/keto reductase n=1 Tax=Candidatus Marimicrobium litorale TaxID=2518991 RepID=A0ABT3T339_9GAMM|nr:aldo/keto reductase [Candidatus Marimicrobium litorale]MCX2975944.1 aldo/keto reductase [Candidatus Marimicrobium litorale]
MQRRKLGRLFDVSRYTLGGGGIGQVWGATSREEAIKTVQDAHEAGITLFDMAPLYGNGEAEKVMGLAFPTGYPHTLRLTTKCMLGGANGTDVERILTASLQESLKLLKRDYIDVFILHGYVVPDNWHTTLPPKFLSKVAVTLSTFNDFVIPAFEKLKKSGRIKAWGVTAASTQVTNLKIINSESPPDVVQCMANVLDSAGSMEISGERAEPRAVIKQAKDQSVGVMGIRAVAAGALTDTIDRPVAADSSEQYDYDRAARFRLIAADMGASPAQLAHRYALSMPGVETVVLGVKNREELVDCLLAEAAPALEASVVQRIDTAVRN